MHSNSSFSTGMGWNAGFYHNKSKKRIGQCSNKGGAESKPQQYPSCQTPKDMNCLLYCKFPNNLAQVQHHLESPIAWEFNIYYDLFLYTIVPLMFPSVLH